MKRLRELLADGRCQEDLRQFLWFGLGYAVVLVLGYLLVRKINLTLTETEMGRFSFVVSAVGMLASVFYLATPQAYLRFHENHAVSARLRRLLLPFFLLAAAVIVLVVWHETRTPVALAYAAMPFFFERLHVFRAQMRSAAVNVLKIAELAVPFLLLTFFGRTADAAMVIAFYGFGYGVCFLFPLRLKPIGAPTASVLGRFLGPVALTTVVAIVIEHLTVIVTKGLLGYEQAAQMGVATRNLIFIRALFSFFQMFYPVVYFREMRNARYGVVTLYRGTVVALSVAFVVILVIGASWLYALTGAAAYVGSLGVFRLLALAALLDFLFETFALYFQYEIKTWKTTLVRILFLIVLGAGFAATPALAARFPSLQPVQLLAASVLAASVLTSLPGALWAACMENRGRGRDGR